MSKNIAIKEGSQSRNFTPNKLKTALQGGGSCLWVPKDGTKLKTISIRKPGTYQAWVEDVYGYSKATVSGLLKESEIKTASKEITENGTYRSEDEGFYGYDVVSVNVPGGGGTAPPSYAPGSSVVGTYPDSDDPVTVSIDDEGNLIKEGLADYIQIDTPPDKLIYKDGERITLAGAVVRGYLKNGTPYKNASYQDSILPLYQYIDTGGDEIPGGIVFPTPLRAKYEGEGGVINGYETSEDPIIDALFPEEVSSLSFPLLSFNSIKWSSTINNVEWRINEGCYGFIQNIRDDGAIIYVASKNNETMGQIIDKDGMTSDIRASQTRTINNKLVCLCIYFITLQNAFTISPNIETNGDEYCIGYYLLYGNTHKSGDLTQTITLTWPREGDRKHLKTSFEITVTP